MMEEGREGLQRDSHQCIQFGKAESEERPAEGWTYKSDTQGDDRA